MNKRASPRARIPMVPGLKINRLTAVSFSYKTPAGSYYWIFKCECGSLSTRTANSVTTEKAKSCGCYDREMKSKRQTKSPGTASCNNRYITYRSNAKNRNISFNLSIAEFKSIAEKDCYICGQPPSQICKAVHGRTTSWTYNGIDRIDNTKGYFIENCKACCWDCNFSKNKRSVNELLKWVIRVYEFQKGKRNGK